MRYFIFNLVDGDRDRAASFLNAKRWVVGREERHRDALASGDLVLVFVAMTSEFVGRAKLETAFLDPIPVDPAASGPAVSGVLLADADAWTSGVPLAVAVQRIDPMGSNPYVQANAAGFRSGVVQITAEEYDKVRDLFSLVQRQRRQGTASVWRPNATRPRQNALDRRVPSIKQMADLVKSPAVLPPLPHQCLLAFGVAGSRPVSHLQHSFRLGGS